MEEHADDEKSNQRQNNIHDEKSGQPLAFDFLSKFRYNPNSQVEEGSRISMKHFPTRSGRGASWWATFGFSVCLLSLKFSKPLLQPQGPYSLWLAIVGMFSFTLFVSSASVMLVVGAHFTQMQVTVMLIAFFALLLA